MNKKVMKKLEEGRNGDEIEVEMKTKIKKREKAERNYAIIRENEKEGRKSEMAMENEFKKREKKEK